MTLPIILASSSESRKMLIMQMGLDITQIISPEIDETPKPKELAKNLTQRLATTKANAVAARVNNGIIIAADTVAVAGRKILHKAKDNNDVKQYLELLSGRRHHIYTGVCIIAKKLGKQHSCSALVKSTLKFKQISSQEISYYCSLEQGIGKAGGYNLNGYAETFVSFISGSYSNILGLPLQKTKNMIDFAAIYLQEQSN